MFNFGTSKWKASFMSHNRFKKKRQKKKKKLPMWDGIHLCISLKLPVWAHWSMPQPSGLWWRKMKLSPRLGLGTILGFLGQSLTFMDKHTRLWARSLGTTWKCVRHLRPPSLWAGLHYVLLGHN